MVIIVIPQLTASLSIFTVLIISEEQIASSTMYFYKHKKVPKRKMNSVTLNTNMLNS